MQGGFATALGTLFTVVATTVLLIYLLLRLRRTNACRSPLPPGPWGVPLLGYLPFLRGQKHVAFKRIAEKYGPLFRVKLGAKTVAVLNNLESISEGYSKLLWRPKALFFDHSGVAGVANLNGRPWVENRRFCFRSLNSGSYGGKAIEQQVQDEVLYLAEKISEAKGEAINVADLLLPSVSNNVTSLVLGSRYDFGDDRRTLLDSLLVRLFWCLTTVSPTSVAPLGLGSITAFFFTKFVQIRSLVDNLGKFLSREVASSQIRRKEENSVSFVEDYKQMICSQKDEVNSCFKGIPQL